MATIEFDYNKAIRQANSIDNVAYTLEKLGRSNLQEFISNVGNNWEGENSSIFLRYCSGTQKDILRQAKDLRVIASKIRRNARIFENAEREAKNALAQNVKY